MALPAAMALRFLCCLQPVMIRDTTPPPYSRDALILLREGEYLPTLIGRERGKIVSFLCGSVSPS
jgi:hypothetical protein